jgi:hypothetical protein
MDEEPKRIGVALSATCLCALLPASAAALEATATVGYAGEYTTNTARTATDQVNEWVHGPRASLGLFQEGARLELASDYQYQQRNHEEDLFEDQEALTGEASLLWRALPQRLDLVALNRRIESAEERLLPNTEANRQTVSYTEVGPTLRFQPQRASELELDYRYADVSTGGGDADSVRHSGSLRYIRDLSAVRSLVLEASQRRTDFDRPTAVDLDTTEGSLALVKSEGRVRYTLTGGYTQTRRDDLDDVTSPLLAGNLGWDLTPITTLTVDASRRLTDLSSDFRAGATEFSDRVDQDSNVTDVFVETLASASLTRPWRNNLLSFGIRYRDEDYEEVPRDNELIGAGFSLTRDLNPRTTLVATVEAGRQEFPATAAEQDQLRGSLRLTRDVSRRIRFAAEVRYEEWDSEEEIATFEEWATILSLDYALLRPRGTP